MGQIWGKDAAIEQSCCVEKNVWEIVAYDWTGASATLQNPGGTD